MSEWVFLMGAGRSGTTLLYKLLALHPEIAVINNYDSKLLNFSPVGLFMRAIRGRPRLKKSFWFAQGGAAYFRPGMEKLFPYPVEGEPLFRKAGVPLVIDPQRPLAPAVGRSLRSSLERLRRLHGGQVFLSKRTANNRRLAWLREVFPEARFINLIRDGREVAYSLSTVDWWEGHGVWWSGQTAAEMEAAGWDRLAICARNWVEEVDAVESGLAGLPNASRMDLRYEQLLADPLTVLPRVLAFMGLEASPAFMEVIGDLNLSERAPKWRSAWSAEQVKQVEDAERDVLVRHGYLTE